MFGDGNGFIGYSGFAPRLVGPSDDYPALATHIVPLAVAFAFSMSYADTPATLIAGTGAERIRFSAAMPLTVVISGLLFPIAGHWILGGGWLAQLDVPVYDIGSGVIHLGGICVLAVALTLGPRMEHKLESEGEEEGVSSMPLVFLGAFILWLGFFAFNAGFAMVAGKPLGLVVVNTALGGSAGTVTAMIGAPHRRIMAEYPARTLPRVGLFYGGGGAQLASQALATAAIIGFVLPAALLACWMLRSLGWLRIPVEEEKEGSDKATHGEKAYEDK